MYNVARVVGWCMKTAVNAFMRFDCGFKRRNESKRNEVYAFASRAGPSTISAFAASCSLGWPWDRRRECRGKEAE